jgi:hypothetical protein
VLEENMNRISIWHCLIVSTIVAAAFSLVSITVHTASVRLPDRTGSDLRSMGEQQTATWVEGQQQQAGRLSSLCHAFRYPGFWKYWFRSMCLLFFAIFPSTIVVSWWNQKAKKQPNQRLESIGTKRAETQAKR